MPISNYQREYAAFIFIIQIIVHQKKAYACNGANSGYNYNKPQFDRRMVEKKPLDFGDAVCQNIIASYADLWFQGPIFNS